MNDGGLEKFLRCMSMVWAVIDGSGEKASIYIK